MKYFYGNPQSPTKDRITHRLASLEPSFSIGEDFDRYDFTQPAPSFSQAIERRLHQLRASGKYIRFWFSGGKDSRLILDNAQRLGIEFDEIVIIRNQILGPTYHMGAIVEIQANAVDYISSIQQRFQTTKITVIDFEDPEFALVFSNSDWIHQTNIYYIHAAIEPNLFYAYVNPEKRYLEDIDDRIDLMGSVHPHIYWDHGWRFVYIDQQFPQNLWHTCENFLTSPSDPSIAHAYAKAVTQSLERLDLRPERFQKDIFSDGNQNLRGVRGLLPEYQFDIHRPDREWPKAYLDPWRPSTEKFWLANPSYKSFLSCLMCYYAGDRSQGFKNYRDKTDWDIIEQEIKYGGILTKEFRLD